MQAEAEWMLWGKAAAFLIVLMVVGSLMIGLSHRALFPRLSEEELPPQPLAEYLCRTRYEREVPNAFLTAAPASTPAPNGFDVEVKGTSGGKPLSATCIVRGHQVIRFIVG